MVSGVLVRDAAACGEALNGRPYYRIFLGLIAELAPAFPADPEADPARLSLIAMVAHVLEELQPQRVPGFAFPWLELISHRCAPPLSCAEDHDTLSPEPETGFFRDPSQASALASTALFTWFPMQ